MREFKVGDEVVVRNWEDMEDEFGLSPGGSIDCKFLFVEEMSDLCGKHAIIESIRDDGRVYIHFVNRNYKRMERRYSFSKDMFAYPEGNIDDVTPVRIDEFILGNAFAVGV